ncbi:MAG: cache domain-containing protein [Nitrosomonas sp.]|nr:cache domain-containing protein [Nitrosomonas sp.]
MPLMKGVNMKLGLKITLSALVPFVVGGCIVMWLTQHQTSSLIGETSEMNKMIRSAYMTNKKEELAQKTRLVRNIIDDYHQSTGSDVTVTKEKINALLHKLEYSKTRDDYFFSYLYDGTNFVHPITPSREGKPELERQDVEGKFHIKEMIDVATTKGKGFVEYTVLQPSRESPTRKISYVMALPDLGIIIGTGVYLNDIDDALADLNREVSRIINSTVRWTAVIVLLSILIVGILQWRMGQNIGQSIGRQKGREQIANNLHDWICQNLIFICRKLDVALEQTEKTPDSLFLSGTLRHARNEVDNTFFEVRLIIDGKDPVSSTLATSLKEYATRFSQNSGLPIELNIQNDIDDLSHEAKIALYSIARLALDNSAKHSAANQINLRLSGDSHYVTLVISDNGTGFEIERAIEGRGLKNMKSYTARLGGDLRISSSDQGTIVEVKIPCKNNKLKGIYK